jgi:ABC-type branched-subunit amino acid transport system substrate-binding protein
MLAYYPLSFICLALFFAPFLACGGSHLPDAALSSHAAATNVHALEIGGIFSLFREDGSQDDEQVEHLAAFLMAVEEINALSPAFIPGYNITFSIFGGDGSIRDSSAAALVLCDRAYMSSSSLIGVVSAESNQNAPGTASILSKNDVNTLFTRADLLSDSENAYSSRSYASTVIPHLSSYGSALQGLMCSYKHTRAMVFGDFSKEMRRVLASLFDRSICAIQILGEYYFDELSQDYVTALTAASNARATVFVVLFESAKLTASLLKRAYDFGILHTGTQWYLYNSLAAELVPSAARAAILTGSVVLEPWHGYAVQFLPSGREFMSIWTQRKPFSDECDEFIDNAGSPYLQSSLNQLCVKLNFTKYATRDLDSSYRSSSFAQTYDAVYLFAIAARDILASKKTLNASTIKDQLLQIEFMGASGRLTLSQPGVRGSGLYFSVRNYQPSMKFEIYGAWDLDNNALICPFLNGCLKPIFTTVNGSLSAEPPTSFPPFSFSSRRDVVRIGGLFSPFLADGTIDKSQTEHMLAFLMAIEEINDKTDGIDDDILPDSQVVYALSNFSPDSIWAIRSMQYVYTAFSVSGLDGIVNALSSKEALVLDMISSQRQLMQVYSVIDDAEFNDGEKHPFKAQTNALYSFSGYVIGQVLCSRFGIRRVVVFTDLADENVQAGIEFRNSKFCSFEILGWFAERPGVTNFEDTIASAKATGGQIFVFFAHPSETAALILQGYNAGLFVEGTQIVVSGSVEFLNYFPEGVDGAHYSKGALIIQPWTDFSVHFSGPGSTFVERLMKFGEDRASYCSNWLDDNWVNFILRNRMFPNACITFNASQYRKGTRVLHKLVGQTYDATKLLLRGIDLALKTSLSPSGLDIRSTINRNVTFRGASGMIDIYEGDADEEVDHPLGRGDRRAGLHYKLLNFIDGKMELIGAWDVDAATVLCPVDGMCSTAVFNTRDGSFPSDLKSTTYMVLNDAMQIALYVLGSFVVAIGVIVAFAVYNFRQHSIIKRAQEHLLYFILLGLVLAGAFVIVSGISLSNEICIATMWLGHSSYAFVFGGIYAKAWRIEKLVNTVNMKRMLVSDMEMITRFALGALFLCAYLILATLLGKPHLAIKSTFDSNQKTVEEICISEVPAFQIALFVIEIAFLLRGTHLCWSIKDIPDKFNEFASNLTGASNC